MSLRVLCVLCVLCGSLLIAAQGTTAAGSAQEADGLLARLRPQRLAAVRGDVQKLRAAARPTATSGEYQDVRAALHVHSRLSHDSVGTPDEIAAAAKKVGIRALFMTEHPTAERKWVTEQVRGERNGVLFIPGAESSNGLLVFRSDEIAWPPDEKVPALLEKLNPAGGVGIICHPEQRTDWNLPAFPAMEIYNTHADAEDHPGDADVLRKLNPLDAMMLVNAFKQYPQEAFAAIFDPPAGLLKTWDGLTEKRPITGIAGNDSHANTGIVAQVQDQKVVLKSPLGKEFASFDQKTVPPFLFGRAAYKAGETILDVRCDPYDVSLGYVSTHLLAKQVTEAELFDALLKGRAYVAFDWLADPSGFSFTAETKGQKASMGDEIPVGARLAARTSLGGKIRLLRGGVEVAKAQGRELVFETKEPGVYRVEVSLPVAGQDRPWIYSNPIYVRAPV